MELAVWFCIITLSVFMSIPLGYHLSHRNKPLYSKYDIQVPLTESTDQMRFTMNQKVMIRTLRKLKKVVSE